MEEQSGDEYEGSAFAKSLMLALAKDGKTCFIVGSILGVLPWQKHGGVVDRPDHLHIISTDTEALAGVKGFLTKTCMAPPEALKFRVYNMEKDVVSTALQKQDNDLTFYNTLMATLQTIYDRVQQQKGVHAVLFSSLTTIGTALLRGLSGDPSDKGAGMDIDKNNRFGSSVAELRMWGQLDEWHCFWEAHLYKKAPIPKPGEPQQAPKDSLLLRGQAGETFPANVGQIFRIRRMRGQKHEGTQCDQMYLDTRSSSDFDPGGRLFTENLAPKEPDLTVALHKLGKRIGRWGAKAAPPKPVAKK